ncbi:hypothetical protein [Dactylosporangium sp. NPDC005555]|uniref:hypothetical protein n=1 Tax=Dactylosporangium sp. NPDC005555 TaxID=3154889 RepID=UPI00339E8812
MNPEEVLRSHAEREVPPVRLLADDVLVTARRRVRRGRIRLVAGVAVAVALIAGVAFASPLRRPDGGPPAVTPTQPPVLPSRSVAPLRCVAAAVPAPPGLSAGQWAVHAIDPTGRFMVGGYGSAQSVTGLVLWKDGVPSRPAAAAEFSPNAVNRDGTAVGSTRGAGGERRAARFRDGTVAQLPLPAGATSSDVFAVNARGDAVGYAMLGDSGGVGLIWPAGGGFVEPSAGEGRTAQVAGVTDDGVVVGTARASDGATVAYRWSVDGGSGAPLAKGTAGSATTGGGDWAAGAAPLTRPRDPDELGPWHARWNLRTGAVEPLGLFTPYAVSAGGTVLGRATEHSSGLALWHDGGVTSLPLLDPARPAVWRAGITADGRTIVAGMVEGDKHDEFDNTRWTC